jgi:L-fuculose-phosphate aldolase
LISFPIASSRIADRIARAVRICNAAKVMDMNGHVSARDPDRPDVLWINSRKASRSTLTSADIVPVEIATGKRIGEGDEPPSEFHIHTEIYKRRPDVGAVVHSHPEHILTLSVAGHALQPVSSTNPFLPEDGAAVFDSAVLINTIERGAAMANALGEGPAVILRQHGTVVAGATLEEAVVRMICAEDNARLQLGALRVGEPRYLRGEELAGIKRENLAPVIIRKFWHYHEESARVAGAFDGLQ